jgi:hypothetical protein
MNGAEVLIPIFGILLVLVPVTGLTLILTARFALKPLVETLAKALRESGMGGSTEAHVQLQELSEQVGALSEQIAHLSQAQEFDRKLLADRDREVPRA